MITLIVIACILQHMVVGATIGRLITGIDPFDWELDDEDESIFRVLCMFFWPIGILTIPWLLGRFISNKILKKNNKKGVRN